MKPARNNRRRSLHPALRRALATAIVAPGALMLLGCPEPLVQEGYGSQNGKSINGFDGMRALLAEESDDFLEGGYITARIDKDADLIVYMEADYRMRYPDEILHFEGWLAGYFPEELTEFNEAAEKAFQQEGGGFDGLFGGEEDGDQPDENEADPNGEEGKEDDEPKINEGEGDPHNEGQPNDETAPEAEGILEARAPQLLAAPEAPVPAEDADEAASSIDIESESAADSEGYSENETDGEREIDPFGILEAGEGNEYRTVLYFMRDTDNGPAFWERVAQQMEGHPDKRNYALAQVQQRLEWRAFMPPPASAPFGSLTRKHPSGEPLRGVRSAPALDARLPGWTVRHIPPADGRSEIAEELSPYDSRDLLWSERGDVLIRELETKHARVLLVYNTENFLNYGLVDPGNRAFARELIRYALQTNEGGERVTAWITGRPVPFERAREQETSIFRALTVYPINVILLHLLLALALFLLSRWPHRRTPLETPPSGTREFLEHIRALGHRLGRSKDRKKALEALLHYKEKTTGQDMRDLIQRLADEDPGATKAANSSASSGKPRGDGPDSRNYEY